MKHMRKLFALALALIMVLSLATTAFATEDEGEGAGGNAPDTNTVKISVVASDSGASVAGHIYNVYQIFTGTVASDGKTLSDIVIGANVTGKTVAEVQAIIDAADDAADAAADLKAIVSGSPVAVLNDGNNHEANVVPGYYLIEDVSTNLPEKETKSTYILQVLESVAIKSKHDATPVTYKKIDDKNDSNHTEDALQWHDSADHDIGDKIDFQLTAVLPSSFDAFEPANQAYPFIFHDIEEDGLEYVAGSAVAYYLNNEGTQVAIPTDQYRVVVNPEDSHSFDVIFTDLTQVDGIKGGTTIQVEYKSTLTENAILGSKGNVNEMFGEYRNFGYPEEAKFTPKDTVIAFTYKVVINKVDEENQPLPGATFTLEKFVAGANGTVTHPEDSSIMGEWVAKETVETEPESVFTFKGLDDGYYRLTENAAPNGYNKIAPIEFTVTAEHNITWETEGREDLLTSLTGNKEVGEITFTPIDDVKDEIIESANIGLSADVENKSGVILPETGGIGTTIFYVVGSLLAVAAVVLLVTKKRMSSAE